MRKRKLLITLTRVYAHDASCACVCTYVYTYVRIYTRTYARIYICVCVWCVCVYTRVHIHMKEISRKCLIFPGSSPLIKSWKKSLLEVLNACDYKLEGVDTRKRRRRLLHRRNLVFVVMREFNDNGHTWEKRVSLPFRFGVIFICDFDGRTWQLVALFRVCYYLVRYFIVCVRHVMFFKIPKVLSRGGKETRLIFKLFTEVR